MKTHPFLRFCILVSLFLSFTGIRADLPLTSHPEKTDAYDGWKLAVQAWTFKEFTFYETIDKVAALGIQWLEAYPGQVLSHDNPDIKITPDLSPEFREEIRQKLDDAGITLINYGVINLPADEKECRKIFEFAKDMGIQTIASEPPEKAVKMIDALCKEYQINVAIHNHPEPSHYWNPETVMKVVKKRSNRLGACGDTGHWLRSGLDPIEQIEYLGTRLSAVHLKDLSEAGNKNAHDVPFGMGKTNIRGVLAALDRIGFEGAISIEYEYNWLNSEPDVRICKDFFNEVASKLATDAWDDPFGTDLSHADFEPGSWEVVNGVLTREGGGYIWSKEKYGNFILDLEFKLAENTNSGVFLRCGDLNNYVQSSIEVQIHETTDGTKHGANGAIYDCLSPSKNTLKPTGEWNRYTITCKDSLINVVLNNEQIIHMITDNWTDPHLNPDGTKNKFANAIKDMPRVGFIGFQDHGQPIWFRNIKIKRL
jgi:sugar phosphate isomerase/epimerase